MFWTSAAVSRVFSPLWALQAFLPGVSSGVLPIPSSQTFDAGGNPKILPKYLHLAFSGFRGDFECFFAVLGTNTAIFCRARGNLRVLWAYTAKNCRKTAQNCSKSAQNRRKIPPKSHDLAPPSGEIGPPDQNFW